MPPTARVKYDVAGVESGDRPVLPAGVYTGTITGADINKPDGKDQRIELVVTVKEDGTDYKLYEYVNLESKTAAWKLRELLEAVEVVNGKKGESGVLDANKMLMGKKIGVKTFIRAADDARGFDEQARIRRMFAADSASVSAVEDLDDDDTADEDNGGETEYDDMTLADLRKEARSRDIKTTRLGADEIIDLLVEDDEAAEGEEPEAEAEAEEPEAEEDGYDDMSMADIRKAARAAKIKTTGMRRAAIVEALREYDAEQADGAEEEPEAEAEADDDYDEWDVEDLRTELKDRSLATKGGKRVLIGRLRRDDAEGDEPF
jgi:hypothetical protein